MEKEIAKQPELSKEHVTITKRENGRLRVQTNNINPSRTVHAPKDQHDINVIMAKYKKTGQLPNVVTRSGVYADMTEMPSYQEALQTVIEANNAFDMLPARVRAKFDNNPQKLMDWLSKPENTKEAIELGLRVPNKPKEATLDDVVNAVKAQKEITKKKTIVQDDE